jgi:formylglycine-generating enzyme required for sulfatase activity
MMRFKIIKTAVLVIAGSFVFGCSTAGTNQSSHEYLQDTLKSGGVAPKLVVIHTGSGVIGGGNFRSFQNEEPVHTVVINKKYAMSVSEITFDEFDAYCQAVKVECPGDNNWGRGRHPVINVTWDEAVAYTKWLSAETGRNYRLPSEAEWEYAARAGKNTKFWWGNEYQQGVDHCDRDLANCPNGTDLGTPIQVGSFKANPFGLFDVTSNVSEWVADCANPNHINAPNDGSVRIDGDCDYRMVKGSNWKNPQPYVHLSKRMDVERDYKSRQIGFRVVREY